MMANTFKVELPEKLEDLKQLLNQQTTASAKERLMMLYWLKSGDITTRQAVAERLNRNPSTTKVSLGGLDGLLEVKVAPGSSPKITRTVREQLQQQLQKPEGFVSLGAIQQWLKDNFDYRDSLLNLID